MASHIIAIAVEHYHATEDLLKVDYARKDAKDVVSAFSKLGCEPDHIFTLFNERATKTSILQTIKRVSETVSSGDRIIIYFSGHGFFEGGVNYLGPVDASITSVSETCVSITKVLGLLNKSESTQKILFLDCCHSGFDAGDLTRDPSDTFNADDLLYQFRNEEFCIGFASCKNNQKSISHPRLNNGVWSHFLVKALAGEAAGIYREGILFSDALQSYLKKQTTEFVKFNTTTKRDQTPIKFGSETDNFVVADLRSIFEELENAKAVNDIPFPSISIVEEEEDTIRLLPGFKSGYHRVPTEFGKSQENFIADIGAPLILKEISKLSISLKNTLKYKRDEMKAYPKTGIIETVDFDYEISITQSSRHPSKYKLTRQLRNFKNSSKVLTAEFNEVFEDHFKYLEFEKRKSLNVEDIIDRIEALAEPSPIKVEYDPSDTSWCKISIEGLAYSVHVTESSIRIATDSRTSPQALIEAYRSTVKALAKTNAIRFIE